MENVLFENNAVVMSGEISSEAVFSHEIYGEKFYSYNLSVKRLSEEVDIIPLTISERLAKDLTVGTKVSVMGQFRSYNKHEQIKNRLVLSVFVREIKIVEKETNDKRDNNDIMLKGYVCKLPTYRKTPLGREVCDLLIAVNRPYGKSDYVPCICWGRNARFAGEFEVSQEITIYGRIQSRKYIKKISEGQTEERIAYEVSVAKIETTSE